MKITITDARREDASLIADAILEAVGPEITQNLAGEKNTAEDVHGIFEHLAGSKDSQYSYLNTRIARDEKGEAIGVCISYDGAGLIRMRRPFFAEANRVLGWGLTAEEIDALPGETSDDEFYLDTLMTLPQHRGKGIAKALVMDAKRKAYKAGKPLGLLCDPDNDIARRLYDAIGFRQQGFRPFAGIRMAHLRLF